MSAQMQNTDALVVGGGITGMQAALDLADQDIHVYLVEKQPSIGGKMIALSKVFPTLDCCSCITTPKMSAVAHHRNITLLTNTEVMSIQSKDNGFSISLIQHPRYVKTDLCTGCRQCEYVCPIDLPNAFDRNLGAIRAVRVPFSTAVPQKAVIDIDNCIICGKCEKACPVDAIDFIQKPESINIEVGAIVLATGFEPTPLDAKREYNAGEIDNVIDALAMERLLAPTGPYGHVLRPSDGKEPDSIAYVQCAGSRDRSLGIEYCSRICCMYAIKQAMLLSGALPLADITIYYIDIRTFGKGYEQFYQNAKAMGIQFIKGKVAKITEDEEHNPVLRVEMIDENCRVVEHTHDLAVLSVGMIPAFDPYKTYRVETERDRFVHLPAPNFFPTVTNQPGIFAAGTATGPMDIVDSIMTASAAASEASAYLYARCNEVDEQQFMEDKEAIHA